MVAAVAPILVSATAAVFVLVERQQTMMEDELQATTRAVLTAVDRELEKQILLVQGLASSPYLDTGDFPAFYQVALRFQALESSWGNVVVTDPQGEQQYVNTLYPLKPDPLFFHIEGDSIRQAAESQRPVVGPMVQRGRFFEAISIPVRAPVIIRDEVRYVVSATVRPEKFIQILQDQELPSGRLVSIFTPDFSIVADSTNNDLIGQPANSSWWHKATSSQPGVTPVFLGDNREVLAVLQQSPDTGWWVAMGTTPTAFWAPLRQSIVVVGIVGLLASSLSLVLSLGIARSIRRRALAEKRAKDEEMHINQERFITALHLRGISVASFDTDLRYTWFYHSNSGRHLPELAGKTHYDFYEDESADRIRDFLRNVLQTGKSGRIEISLQPRGRKVWHHYDLVAAPLTDATGRLIGLTSAAARIDAEVEARRKLQEAVATATRADTAKSRFLAAASHDLRQPFQAMNLYQQVLELSSLPPKAAQALEGLSKAMKAGEELLTSLLDVSSFEAGTIKIHSSVFPLDVLIEEIAQEYYEMAEQSGLRLKIHGLPVMVETDRVLLKRMLRNLVNNAFRYTNRGGILIGCRQSGGNVLIQVWDTGSGIPDDKLDMIFEDFYQLGNPERDRTKGLGLGLSIVQRMAHLLGLRITVASRLGRGSVFTIVLPENALHTPAPPKRLAAAGA
ncbi:PAS domain-containing sensor histidine kinase [Telmatospirillum sp. J64-1]|uniref:sensor histidine kinase n=1 Tax=Telmatospirillum sp. J64-1 TaxID=2502183 RepID=UPI00163D6E41|nr:PAS domain-containing sensor histidine kinase [Telmatospirillum sp. J64-1]